jgi:gliding motility-associated-like protein
MNINFSILNRNIKKLACLSFVFVCCGFFHVNAQITITPNPIANNLAQALVGGGVTISNPTLVCGAGGTGLFTLIPPNTTNLGLSDGILLTSGSAVAAAGFAGTTSVSTGNGPDPDLDILTIQTTFDKCVLEFDFVPIGDSIKFDYVFASSEYQSYTCSNFNDVFGFFLSGPGITGPFSGNSKNIALIPGTNCPVGVNTINGSTASPCGSVTSPCAPPNNALFIDNIGGTTVVYNGFTQVLTAVAAVTNCQTHHLKLAISDATDQILDSGVWLKQGSLSSTSVSFSALSSLVDPDPYMVEGCNGAVVRVSRSAATALSYTINYTLGGTASGADYVVSTQPLPSPAGTVVIPAGDTVAYIIFNALGDGITEPVEEIIINQLASCDTAVTASVSLFIKDSIELNIVTPDTAICNGDGFNVIVNGNDSMTYVWSPTIGVSNPNIKQPFLQPTVNTNYVVCASIPGTSCPSKCDSIQVVISTPPNVQISNDTIICKDMSIPFNPIILPNQTYTYQWGGSAAAFLQNSLTSPTQIGNFNTMGNYILTLEVEPTALGCAGFDTVNIQVIPNDITLHNGDTTVCYGASFPVNVTGHPLFNYNWTPPTYLSSPTIEDPLCSPLYNTIYTVTATYGGCIPMTKSFEVLVEPNPNVNAGLDRVMCDHDTIQLAPTVLPSWFTNYTYTWSPGADLDNPNIESPVFSGSISTILKLIVTTSVGCKDSDIVIITVHPTEFAGVSPQDTTICPRETVQYLAGGGSSYYFTPEYLFDDANIFNPKATPLTNTEITLYSTSAFGCVDTDRVYINVSSDASLELPEEATLFPGESIRMPLEGNCSAFTWFPNYHLTADNVKQPTANPPVTTKYRVTGVTEHGCVDEDSIIIRISPESILDLPNAFSPGTGTSVNDELRIIRRGLATLSQFVIYNRWGQKVFETTDINKGWNGQLNGKPQPLGSYVYVIDAVTNLGTKIHKQGNVTLIR